MSIGVISATIETGWYEELGVKCVRTDRAWEDVTVGEMRGVVFSYQDVEATGTTKLVPKEFAGTFTLEQLGEIDLKEYLERIEKLVLYETCGGFGIVEELSPMKHEEGKELTKIDLKPFSKYDTTGMVRQVVSKAVEQGKSVVFLKRIPWGINFDLSRITIGEEGLNTREGKEEEKPWCVSIYGRFACGIV